MSRIPPAARILITQINNIDPSVQPILAGGPDGFGVHREIRFTKSEWVGDVLEAVGDPRIASIHKENAASTLVTFVGDTRADRADGFDLDGAYEILTSQDPQEQPKDEGGDQDEDEQTEDDSEADAR